MASRDKSRTVVSENMKEAHFGRLIADASRAFRFASPYEMQPACGVVDVNATPIVRDAPRDPPDACMRIRRV